MKQTDQSNQQNQSGQNKQNRTQSELDGIIRNGVSSGKFKSQSDANSYLQQHGLSCEMKESTGAVNIFDETAGHSKIASVQFQSSDPSQREVSNITYS